MAKRYAKALLEAAAEAGVLEQVAADLEALGPHFAGKEVAGFFANPAVPRARKEAALAAAAERASASPLSVSLLRLLVARERVGLLPDIARLFRDLADERTGRVRAEVTAAVPLPAASLEALAARLSAATGRQVHLTPRVDPTVLGGLVARVGSTLYDASLRTQLRRMREVLSKG
ncbi:MAG: ATP synthase F1 subunit delta [candidate division NC10 bacterium]|mgnify:CR=1 FL=1